MRANISHDNSAYQVSLAAGLGVAVHTQILDDFDADSETDKIVSEVTSDSRHNSLTQSAQALFTLLTDGQPVAVPDELRKIADSGDLSENGCFRGTRLRNPHSNRVF